VSGQQERARGRSLHGAAFGWKALRTASDWSLLIRCYAHLLSTCKHKIRLFSPIPHRQQSGKPRVGKRLVHTLFNPISLNPCRKQFVQQMRFFGRVLNNTTLVVNFCLRAQFTVALREKRRIYCARKVCNRYFFQLSKHF